MSESDVEEDQDGELAEAGKKKLSGKKLVLFIVLPLLLVLGGGGAGAAWYLGAFGGGEAELASDGSEGGGKADSGDVVFYDLPEMLVNLNTGSKQSSFLKIKVALELEEAESLPILENLLPRIVDNFQVYLRELRREDLSGSAGLYRLKEELMARVNLAIQPARINDVLFKEMLVQ